MNPQQPLVVEPAGPADAALILVHGLGTRGSNYESMGRRVAEGVTAQLRVVLPTAPERRVGILSGGVNTAWFDLREQDFQADEDTEGIRASCEVLAGLVRDQVDAGIAANRIVLAGFSQGGALALRTGTTLPLRLGGIAALSGWLPLADDTRAAHNQQSLATPVFLGHGVDDELAPRGWADEAGEWLAGLGHPVTRRDYPIGHAINLPEIDDLARWIDALL